MLIAHFSKYSAIRYVLEHAELVYSRHNANKGVQQILFHCLAHDLAALNQNWAASSRHIDSPRSAANKDRGRTVRENISTNQSLTTMTSCVDITRRNRTHLLSLTHNFFFKILLN